MSAKILQLEHHPRFKAPPTADSSLATRFESDLQTDYRLLLVGQGKTPDTVRTYTQHFRRYLKWCKSQELDPFYISQREVAQHIADMTERGLGFSVGGTKQPRRRRLRPVLATGSVSEERQP